MRFQEFIGKNSYKTVWLKFFFFLASPFISFRVGLCALRGLTAAHPFAPLRYASGLLRRCYNPLCVSPLLYFSVCHNTLSLSVLWQTLKFSPFLSLCQRTMMSPTNYFIYYLASDTLTLNVLLPELRHRWKGIILKWQSMHSWNPHTFGMLFSGFHKCRYKFQKLVVWLYIEDL